MPTVNSQTPPGELTHHQIHLPEPTAWPILLAMGLVLCGASLITNYGIGILGVLLTVVSAVGWFRDVLPRERHEAIEVQEEIVSVSASSVQVRHVQIDETHRAQLPLKTFPISSGIKGGIAGGIAMIIPAEAYGILRFHSIWYVINLLGGAGVAGWTNPTTAQISQFHLSGLVTATVIQVFTCLLVGLLYGALLPIWPKHPILLGGIIAPAIWTGVLHNLLGIINPFLDQRIDWWSFAASQVFFGLVAGYTVTRLGNLKSLAQVPLAARLGVETPDLMGEHEQGRSK